MKLIIVRHGQTEENANGIIQGRSEGRLNEKGLEQARKIALDLKDEKIDVIFSSDLRRAKDTTEEIAKFHDVPVHYTELLRERSSGIFDGRPVAEMKKFREENNIPQEIFKPQSGESFLEVEKRLRTFMDNLYREYSNKTVLISTHGAVIRTLYSIYFHIPLAEAVRMKTTNTGVLVIEATKSSAKKIKDKMFV